MSIRHKLQGIVIVACGGALFMASAAFTFYDRTTFLRTKTEDLTASAKMIGSNSTAALTFHDAGSAREILSALQAKPHVTNACIYDSDGKVFAKYGRDPTEAGSCPPHSQGAGSTIAGRHMVLFHNIELSGDSIGSIYIEADLADLNDRLLRFLVIDFVVLLGSLAVALLLAYRLQRVISGPIQELAETASPVSAHENYSIRAVKTGGDEIGVLFDQFNRCSIASNSGM
jgi:methyl-accepting chemotaxis protein